MQLSVNEWYKTHFWEHFGHTFDTYVQDFLLHMYYINTDES